uniref:Homeobox protein prospero n=1 Tax=Strigamia maritima TaxID=126957 RepID=T1J0U6_STRMM
MSSEDENEAGPYQKKNKRTRQRVDAGEPRNSYASIPNFCSRPSSYLVQNGPKMLNELLANSRTPLRCEVDFASDSTVDSTDLGLRLNGTAPTNGVGSDSSSTSCGGILLDVPGGPPDSPQDDRTQLLREILQGSKTEGSSLISQLLKVAGDEGPKSAADEPPSPGKMMNGASVEQSTPRVASTADEKRARVETIVSGIRCEAAPVNGCKKRKHYQPQQHEAATAESVPKHRRLEREVLRKQLGEIQAQLVQMQQRYFELFETETSDSEVDGVGIEAKMGGLNIDMNMMKPMVGLDVVRANVKSEGGDQHHRPESACADLMDPAQFIDEARRLVHEQEKLTSIKFPGFGRLSSVAPVDVDGLADALKTEIAASIAVLVDSILMRYVPKRSRPLELPKDILDRRSPRTKIVDRGNGNVPVSRPANGFASPGPYPDSSVKGLPSNLMFPKSPMTIFSHQPSTPPHPPFVSDGEQNEALSLVVTPRKKRHKVTDTRITPRTVSRLLNQEPLMSTSENSYHPPPLVPASLPTSVAIPNPSLHHSDVFSYPFYPGPHHVGSPPDTIDDDMMMHPGTTILHSSMVPRGSPDTMGHMKNENGDGSDCNSADVSYDNIPPVSSTLTPMHLRKAKLMFFFVRYPSSAILKMYFPDIKFNKNNTAQLVKWFSNFREFYYIQMEKYARQAISEGTKCVDDLSVSVDSELYRVLNLHYNRNNHIEVPTNFRYVVEQTLREFFKAIACGKDQEQSWKKSIYKVIARMDDNLPEYFKSPNFLEQLE